MSTCPDSCRGMLHRHRAFVHGLVAGLDVPAAWRAAGSKASTPESLKNAGLVVKAREDVARALEDHLAQVGEAVEAAAVEAASEVELEGIAADASREAQVLRLARRATGSAMRHLLTVRQPIAPDPDLLRMIADDPDPAERTAALRRFLAVEIVPWDEVPDQYLDDVAEVSQSRDGTVRYKVHAAGPAENLLAEIQDHKAPKRHKIEDVEEFLAAMLGDP